MATGFSGKYFISYAHTEIDSKWAEWIAWQLESAGHEVILDKWDFQSGQNFPLLMHQAIIDSKKIIAILSREYSANRSHAANEWTSAYNSKKLLVIQIEQLNESELGLLSPINRINLTNFISKNDAIKHLLKNIDPTEDGRREKSDEEPPFPGDLSEESDTNDVQKTIANGISREELNHYEFKAGLVDKDQQAGHIMVHPGSAYFWV